MKKIPLVFITDDAYALPTGVAIQSIIEHKAFDTVYDIHIVDIKMTEENRRRLSAFVSQSCSVSFIPAPDMKTLEKYIDPKEYVTPACLLKYNIADWLPQYDKVLYLDSDILVQKDLCGLYDSELADTGAGVIKDMLAVKCYHLNDRIHTADYFNAGILLLNTAKFRRQNLCERLYKTKQAHPEYECMDQTVFNQVLQNDVTWLNLKYNLIVGNQQLHYFTIVDINVYYGTNYLAYEDMYADTVIFHLASSKKPWKHKKAFLGQKWQEYYKRSPFADIPLTLTLHFEDQPLSRLKKLVKHFFGLI